MTFIEQGLQCATCGRQTLHRQQRPNHVLHFLIAFFTCGLWVIPWIVMSMGSEPWLCTQCGGRFAGGTSSPTVAGGKSASIMLIFVGAVAIIVLLLVSGLVAAFVAKRMGLL